MEAPEDDSGFAFADDQSLGDEVVNVFNFDVAEELDEGIVMGNLVLPQEHQVFLHQHQDLLAPPEEVPVINVINEDGENVLPDFQEEIQVQEQFQQGEAFPADLQLVGDDNNNDQPDDVNNNTTDPQLQQIQQEQLRLQQQRNQQVIETANEPEKGGKKDKRKKKKKKKKHRVFNVQVKAEPGSENYDISDVEVIPDDVEIEYVPEKLELSVFDPMYKAFANVFENFRISDGSLRGKTNTEDVKPKPEDLLKLSKVPKIDLEEMDEKKDDEKPKMSKRKLKKLTRLSVAELKQVVPRPDVVEMHDVTARDPKLLVHLKSYRNTVPVPRHWCFKRKYLQGKRGIEKAPFDLPGFIKKTGIMEMRAALAEKEETKTLKAKMRERVRPKMGKIDVDYQKLHDAFFKWQSKPKMTIHGDLYYEGKEFETRMKDKKPGDLSDDLRTALGMPIGPNSNRIPPPWLIAMQRYGPPPSYPHQKVPGLNAPIPDNCSFGYHAGGWGKPPVDEMGRPLYGDVFGITNGEAEGGEEDGIQKGLWGELESEEEVESEEEEEEEEDEKEDDAAGPEDSGMQTPSEGLTTPSGFSSIPAGLETPELIELRKRRIEQDMEGGETPNLYTVLPEKRVDRIAGSMMASTHVYDVSAASGTGKSNPSRVEVALDPSELDMDSDHMAARYEQKLREEQSHLQKEDLSDMVAEHAAKQKNKRKRQLQQQPDPKQAKKYKEFKF